jgi:FlaA1/EpsC-like NDP-sugar epimerase
MDAAKKEVTSSWKKERKIGPGGAGGGIGGELMKQLLQRIAKQWGSTTRI